MLTRRNFFRGSAGAMALLAIPGLAYNPPQPLQSSLLRGDVFTIEGVFNKYGELQAFVVTDCIDNALDLKPVVSH